MNGIINLKGIDMKTLVQPGEIIFGAIAGSIVQTLTHDYSGEITVVDRKGDYLLLRKAAGTAWQGRCLDRAYVPVEYWLVSIQSTHTSASGKESLHMFVHNSVAGKEKKKVSELKELIKTF
jgi:hypothetical protein